MFDLLPTVEKHTSASIKSFFFITYLNIHSHNFLIFVTTEPEATTGQSGRVYISGGKTGMLSRTIVTIIKLE